MRDCTTEGPCGSFEIAGLVRVWSDPALYSSHFGANETDTSLAYFFLVVGPSDASVAAQRNHHAGLARDVCEAGLPTINVDPVPARKVFDDGHDAPPPNAAAAGLA